MREDMARLQAQVQGLVVAEQERRTLAALDRPPGEAAAIFTRGVVDSSTDCTDEGPGTSELRRQARIARLDHAL